MKIFTSFTVLISALFLSACNDSPKFAKGDCVQKPDSMVVWKYEGKMEDGHQLSQNSNPSVPPIKMEEDLDRYNKSVCK